LLVINTFAVTQEAVKKSHQLIRKSHRINPLAKLIVSGCYSSLPLISEIDAIDLIIPNNNKDQFAQLLNDELNIKAMPAITTKPDESALFS
jgi:threonylcarbamoyladenosine tRNA methylthiotransferase MtaB